MKATQNIGILGIGAIGSTISCVLNKENNQNFYYFNRSKRTKIEVQFPDETLSIATNIESYAKESIYLDWLIICLKEYQYKNATALIRQLISPHTKVALIRNGLNLSDSISHFCPIDNILPCIIDCPVETNLDGSYHALRHPKLIIPKDHLANSFTSLFGKSASLEIVDDFKRKSWEKLIESAGLGLVMVHINGTCKDILEKKVVHLYQSLIEESIQVAHADGIDFDDAKKDQLIQKLYAYSPEKGSSMLRDFRNNNTIEWWAKSGIIMNLGLKYNLDLPVHNLLSKKIIQDL